MALTILVGEFAQLLTESAAFHETDHPEVTRAMRQACMVLKRVRHRLSKADNRYIIAMVGSVNVGKSTLLNALFGKDLAPQWNGPCTAFPIEFTHGDQFRVKVAYRNTFERPSWQCENAEESRQRLDALTADNFTSVELGLDKVSVEAPLPILQRDVVVADTPGFGAAQFDTQEGSHEAALNAYLGSKVAQVFWVVRAEQAISMREKTFYETTLLDTCDDLVVTGCEDYSDVDCKRFQKFFGKELSNRFLSFYFVSGRNAVQAKNSNDAVLLQQSGIPTLETYLRNLGDKAQRCELLQRRIHQVAEHLGDWLQDYRNDHSRPIRTYWRPDSWSRWQEHLKRSDHPATHNLTQLLKETR